MIEIEFKGDLTRVELRDGDVLVLHCDGDLSSEQADRLRQLIEKSFPGRNCVVFGKGLQLSVTQETADA